VRAGAGPGPDPGGPGDARTYHDLTKHSPASVRGDRHFLDWAQKPLLFKDYPDAPAVPLPREIPAPEAATLDAVARVATPGGQGPLDLTALAALLFFSAGLTKRRRVYPGDEVIHFRAAPSTGALYQTEVYVVAGRVTGLEPGVYHFGPRDFALRRLRDGDHRRALAAATGDPGGVTDAPATLILSAIHWRNAWKYRARAYRHFFWDAGSMLANLLATAAALDVAARVLLAFADPAVNALLGLDPAREGSLAAIPVGRGAGPAPPAPPAPPLAPRTVPLSSREVDYPLVRAAYQASALPDGAAARAWLGSPAAPRSGTAASAAPTSGAAGAPGAPVPSRPLGETILRRGSTREFRHAPLGAARHAAILDAALRPLPLDVDGAAPPLVETYFLVHAVEGLAPGAYAWDRGARALRPLRRGQFRREGAELCLEQALGGDASVVAFFLSQLGPVLARWGERGYRAANLAAGLLGGRLYLAAYGVGAGATGLTFYDDEVVRFFEPDAAGSDALFVTAVGYPAPRVTRGLAQASAALEPLRPGEA
jgi:SagB-type dehydrogenase family enzyme